MHYYQFHIGDYKSHTHHLSLLEDLAYRRLLDFYFLHENPIKHRDIARQIGMRDHEEDVMTVLNEFFLSTENGFVNPRADKEIKQYKEFAEAGKRGAAKRWGTPPNGEANSPPNATPIATNNHKPITTNHKLDITTKVVCASGDAPALLPEHIVEEWNKTSAKMGKPKVRNLTPERRQNLKARIGQYSIDDFHEVFSKIERSAFLRGETQGWPRGATFDWTFKKANFQKILEGNYDS